MPEINLLPDELRGKEIKELKAVRKKPRQFRIEMSSPQKEVIKQPLKVSKPSLLSRLFSKKTKPGKPIEEGPESVAPKIELAPGKRAEEKVVHIPEVKPTKPKSGFNLFSGFSKGKNKKPEVAKPTLGGGKKLDQEIKEIKLPNQQDEIKLEISKSDQGKKKRKFSFNLFSFLKFSKKKKKGEKEKEFKPKKGEKVEISDKKQEEEKKEGKLLGVNLIPEELTKHLELELPKKLFVSGMVILIFVLLAAAAYLGISWYQINMIKQIEQIEQEIEDINKQIAGHETKKLDALDLQKRLSAIRQLLDIHVYWTKFFDMLEKYTIPEIYYTNFSMVGNDKLSISAIGKDYNSVAKQLVVFQNATDFVSDVRIDSASAEIEISDTSIGSYVGVTFVIHLEFLPNIFLDPIE